MKEAEDKELRARELQRLSKMISDSPLDNPTRETLLRRLSVANRTGERAVARDFDREMELYRAAHLPSYRPKLPQKWTFAQPAAKTPAAPSISAPSSPPPPRSCNTVVRRARPILSWRSILRRCQRAFDNRQTDFLSALSFSGAPQRQGQNRKQLQIT